MSDISSANFSLEGPYAFTKHHSATLSANYIPENHPAYAGGDWVPIGVTTRVNKNQVAIKVQTLGGTFAASTTCTVNATFITQAATDGGYISMNEVSASAGMQIWVRSKTNLV